MNQRNPLADSLNPDAFRVAEALVAGASRKRLRAHDLNSPFHGARSSTTDARPSLLPLMALGDAFCGPTAAKIWQLPLPRRHSADPRIHVSLLGNRRMRRAGVVSSRRGHGIPMMIGGLPVLDPIATWISLGGILSPADLTAVLDRLVSGTLRHPRSRRSPRSMPFWMPRARPAGSADSVPLESTLGRVLGHAPKRC